MGSEQDRAEYYLKIEQEQELKLIKEDIFDNISNCCSDDEYESGETQ